MLRRSGRCVAASLLLVGLTVSTLPAEEVGNSGYYPLQVGTEWRYGIGDKEVVARVVKHELKGGFPAARVESSLNEKLLSTEHIAVTKDGVFRVAFGDEVASKPVMILKLPPKAGETWPIETTISGSSITGTQSCTSEKVTVPAGTFDVFKVSGEYKIKQSDDTTTTTKFVFWFADGTGVVKLSMDDAVTMELKKFTPAGD